MPSLAAYSQQSRFSAPGDYSTLFDPLPADLPSMSAAVRNVIVHYRASGIDFPAERLAEINNRWVERILATDQARHDAPLDQPRAEADRVAGCCRDYTLLTVAGLRHHGIPARSRIGFATYFDPSFRHDHVIVEYWNGERWVFADAQLNPGPPWPFDTDDMPRHLGAAPAEPPVFETSAQVWTAFRRGDIDANRYGVHPDVPIGGPWFIRNYVLLELAHRLCDETLLWDGFGAMAGPDGADKELELVDEVAALLLAADDEDESAEAELAERYRTDERLHVGSSVLCISPTGEQFTVDV